MSDVDSFIEEVTEEVRRDRLYKTLRRWGWIGILAVIIIVGGAAFNEYRKAKAVSEAQELGDQIIAALAADDPAGRAAGLAKIEAKSAGGDAVVQFLLSTAQSNSDSTEAAVEGLNRIATTSELPEIYRHIATFKSLLLQTETLPVTDRRQQFEALAAPGAPLRLLAEEQLALIEVEEGDVEAAVIRLEGIRQDAEVSVDLQQRATQLIVALGGDPAPVIRQQG
ncbi:hypothetical protein AVO45_06570 [Ruegeria marisrubri]|uniref:Tetratricopeptide repeat-like domain-containing protein n=1 Tax=Ruegeria marisrubri TaxID=1685379 RepID=A0A0X3TYI0_9RHOB|nr:hypothetical protein [Ruegeria marisrubri]KUJ80692.1 hypothetical protein AVO45_06570 [Ruegeria marisrubri]